MKTNPYCPFCFSNSFSASGVLIVARGGVGPAFEAAAEVLIPMFRDSPGF